MADTANPAPLGLMGFGLTTVLLSSINAGLLPATGEPVVIPLAMAFGGTAQIIAGIMEFKTGNVFGATAFTSYGAFWWWFALLVLFGGNHLLDLSGAGSAIGVCLLLWGVFTLGLWISTFRLSRLVFGVFLTLWLAFFLLGGAAVLATTVRRGDVARIDNENEEPSPALAAVEEEPLPALAAVEVESIAS